MTRNFALTLAFTFSLTALPGCDKVKLPFGKKPATPTPAAVAPAAPVGSAALPPPPLAPDIGSGPSAPTAPSATPVPAAAKVAPSKPQVDTTASVMALCYHNIEDKGGSKSLTITTAQFEKEMQALKDNGFTVIPMQDFLAWRRGEKSIPKKSCLITIDDGWVSGYTNAWPVLKKFDYPFTLFIYVNYVGSGGKSLSWAQLEEMRDAGVDIQSHTYSHANLRAPGSGVDARTAALIRKDIAELGKDGWLTKEIAGSKAALEERLGIKVNVLAYPFGNHTTEARAAVKAAGYEAAFTVYGQRLTHTAPSFDLLGRYAIDSGKPAVFESALQMIGGGGEPVATTTVTQLASSSMITQPMDGETINNPKPIIKANLATVPGEIDPASVTMRIGGVGAVPVKYDPTTKTMTAPLTQPLSAGSYTVILSVEAGGQKQEVRWGFKFAPGAKPTSPADAPLPPPPPRP